MKDLSPCALRAYSPYSYTTGNAAIWIIELIQANRASTIVMTVIPPIQKFNNIYYSPPFCSHPHGTSYASEWKLMAMMIMVKIITYRSMLF